MDNPHQSVAALSVAELNLARAERARRTLSGCNRTLIRAEDEPQFLRDLCRVIVEVGGYRMAWVGFLVQDKEKSIHPVAQFGFEKNYLESAHVSWSEADPRGQGPCGRAARSRKVEVVQNIQQDASLAHWHDDAKKHGFAAGISLPLLYYGAIEGVLTIYSSEPDAFVGDEVALLQEMADDMAYGINALRMQRALQQSAERIQRGLEGTLRAISATLEQRDPYTAGHQRRVAELGRAIARRMGLPEETAHGVYLAGIVHDIGKIHIPAEILSRPRRLDEMEYGMVKTHPRVGYEILKDIEFPWPIAETVLQHHERMDGSGYPQGLKGRQIIMEARIIAVADVMEAMASHRPYRAALGLDAALAEILCGRSTHYDAAAVDACIGLFREEEYELLPM